MENNIQRTEQNHVGVYGAVFDEPKEKVLLILKGRGPYKGMYDLPGGSRGKHETVFSKTSVDTRSGKSSHEEGWHGEKYKK